MNKIIWNSEMETIEVGQEVVGMLIANGEARGIGFSVGRFLGSACPLNEGDFVCLETANGFVRCMCMVSNVNKVISKETEIRYYISFTIPFYGAKTRQHASTTV